MTGERMNFYETRKQIDQIVLGYFQGDEEKMRAWLNTPNPALGDVTPMKTPLSKLLMFVQSAMSENDTECMGCQ